MDENILYSIENILYSMLIGAIASLVHVYLVSLAF